MIANELTDRIGELWCVECELPAGLFASMVEASDSPDTLVDAVIVAGSHDESLQLDIDTIDQMTALLDGSLETADGSDEPVELSGKWQKVGGSSVYVDDGRITKGCPGLKGERVEDLIDESDDSREEREARQQHAEAKGIKGHQVTATDAKKLGKVRHVAALRSAKGAAKRYNVSTRQVLQVMPDAFQHLKEQLAHREAAKERARQITGLNAGVLARIENAHRDYSTVPKFDTAARSVAYEHPELGLDPDSADTAPAVWELIREGREELPDRNGSQVAEVAAQMIAASKSRGRRKPEPQQQQNDEWGDFDEQEDASFNPDDFPDDGDTSFDPASFEKSSQNPSPRRAVIGHVSKQLKTLHKAASELNHFKNIARANGIDPDDVIEALGGVPFSVRMAMAMTGTTINADVARAARETDRHPTEEQRRAGNYRKGRFRLWGREIVIENARGSVRNGRDAAGVDWSVQMAHHYGYIRQTESEADGDHLDVYIGPDLDADTVYVIDQVRHDGQFDEHKIMLGFLSPDDAQQGYLDSYSPGWDGFGGLTTMTRAEFLDWIDHGDTSRPLAGG